MRTVRTRLRTERLASALGWTSLVLFAFPLVLRIVGSAVGMTKPAHWSEITGVVFALSVASAIAALVVRAWAPREDAIQGARTRVAIGDDQRWLGGLGFVLANCVGLGAVMSVHPRGAVSLPVALAWLAWFVGSFVATRLATTAPEVVVGVDGLTVRTPLRDRFVSFAELASVTPEPTPQPTHLRLRFRDGREERLRLVVVQTTARTERIQAIARHVDDALRAREEAIPAAQLDRAGRAIEAWRSALADLARRRAAYRGEALSRDELVRILERPETSPEHRVAAALALVDSGEPDAHARIRVAADACANDRLRVALEKLADGEVDDEALERAL